MVKEKYNEYMLTTCCKRRFDDRFSVSVGAGNTLHKLSMTQKLYVGLNTNSKLMVDCSKIKRNKMLTYEQKAGTWDGLEEAMNHKTMASEFLALMQQVESKREGKHSDGFLTTAST